MCVAAVPLGQGLGFRAVVEVCAIVGHSHLSLSPTLAQAVGFRRRIVFGQHIRHFPGGHFSFRQETQELLGHLREVLLVPDAVLSG